MLSNQITKITLSLEKKKFREKYNLFKVEGDKLVHELLSSNIKIKCLIAKESWFEREKHIDKNIQKYEADEKEIKSI